MTRLIPQKKSTFSSNRETQRFFACHHSLDAFEHIRQRGRVHYLRGRVANFLHHDPDPATALVAAFSASHVSRLADTRQWRDWPVQDAHNVTDADQVWIAAKEIPAALALPALEEPLVLEFE